MCRFMVLHAGMEMDIIPGISCQMISMFAWPILPGEDRDGAAEGSGTIADKKTSVHSFY